MIVKSENPSRPCLSAAVTSLPSSLPAVGMEVGKPAFDR